VYQVKDSKMLFRGEMHRIQLPDGLYVIRKLLPVECERLQTLPDGYTEGISNTQRYKCLGNGWTAEVIIHILSRLLEGIPKDEPLQVLSMYDGIGTGRYCLEQLGFSAVKYCAYEIDPYAIRVAKNNYPDIIECGDAFDIINWRNES
jgi:DNA (cytosine-5)-methyltransferase 3A